MNQDEEVPTRVTRGALRRRSVDQEATPQKPAGAATNGTPKKSASTTKKVSALNAIQETEGRPSTPIVGRSTRRRMSETVDTPTTLPNKMVQNLKESESSTETGRRSRNASLTEENLNELNATYEAGCGMLPTRSRTPARLRASQETLAPVSSPQFPVRRSTRRNSVTSDDGSVQSLPVTTPKVSAGLRTVKDDTIIEEDPNEERAESVSSEASSRVTRRLSAAAVKSSSPSPRRVAVSPVMNTRNESTPPRGVRSSPLAQPRGTPPSMGTKEIKVVVADLRNSEFMGVTPKVDAEVDLLAKSEANESPNKSIVKSPKKQSANGDATQTMHAVEEPTTVLTSPKPAQEAIKPTNSAIKEMNASIAASHDDGPETKLSSNDVSGIEVLDASQDVNGTLIEANSKSDGKNQSWVQSVRRSASQGIDEFSVRKQEEQERLEEETEKLQQAQAKSPFTSRSPQAEKLDDENDYEMGEEEEEEEAAQDKNELVDDEALEMEGYESGDSLASDLRKEMEDNEIVDQGEDLGSEDTEDNDDEQEEDEDDEDGNDSFIVSTGEEDELLRDSEDEDLKAKDASLVKEETKKTPTRRRIIEIPDDSDEDVKENTEDIQVATTPKSPKSPKNTSFKDTPMSVEDKTPSKEAKVGTPAKKSNLADEGNTPAKKSNAPEITEVVESKDEGNSAADTTAQQNTSMDSSGDVVQLENIETNPATPVRKTPSKETGSATKSATKSLSNSKNENVDNEAASGEENNTSGNSDTMFPDAEENEESSPGSANNTVKEDSFLKSPAKSPIKSRKSLPAASVQTKEPVGKGRKSLPANAYDVQGVVKADGDDEPETSQPEDEVPETVDLADTVDEALNEAAKELDDSNTQADTASPESTLEQPKGEIESRPDRKSMPAVSMISAQFYIGGSKKRATISGGDSLPSKDKSKKPKEKEEKKVATATDVASSVVPNPFALGANGAKAKARLSLDSGAAAAATQPVKEKPQKGRQSLPSKFIEEPMEVDEAPLGETASKEAANGGDKGDEQGEVVVVEDEKQQTKVPKSKRKALEDYDLANILSRCNEVIREDKERKKEAASALRKKREEKKRLRELKKQQEELEAAKEAAAASTSNDNDGGLNSSTTGNDSVTQGGEPLKKKKKRKPKVKNYLLEELAETKKERLEQALRHKLEALERRKQRKKERLLEQKKQLDKENGVGTAAPGAGSGGIGAKLEKMKKKQKAAKTNGEKLKEPPVRVALSAFAVFNQLHNNQMEPLEGKKQEIELVAQSKTMQLAAVEKKQLKKSPKKEQTPEQPVELKEDVKKGKGGDHSADENKNQTVTHKQNKTSPKKEEPSEQPEDVKGVAKKAKGSPSAEEKENQSIKETKQKKKKLTDKNGKAAEQNGRSDTSSSTVDKTPSVNGDMVASTKKAIPAVKAQSESALKNDSKPANAPLSKSASEGMLKEEAGKLKKKQKRKLAMMESATETPEAVEPAAPTNAVAEKRKDKKKRKEAVLVEEESTQNELDVVIAPKQKKNKKQTTQHGNAEENASQLAVDSKFENHTETAEVSEKKKKKLKKQLAVQDEEHAHSTVEKSRKNVTSLKRDPTAAPVMPTKKRKREQTDSPATVESTPRPPAKHSKLRVLQSIESGGFFEETVTPDKIRLKRNFGFEERQATPAKQLGFRVSSIMPTDQDELRAAASSAKMHSKGGQTKSSSSKHGGGGVGAGATLPKPNRSLPLPVWTSSGMFLESPADDDNSNGSGVKKMQTKRPVTNPKTNDTAGYIQLKGQGKADFRLKTLRPTVEKPNRVDPSTTEQSVLNFKRQQLLEKTAHLREKKSHRV